MVRRLINLPWAYLPRDKAAVLAVIASVRVVDFYQIASFQTCIALHLQHLHPDLSATEVAGYVGVVQGAFTAAQIVSAPVWGIAADRVGRKAVIVVGLVGTAAACAGVAFAGSVGVIVFWRFFAGAINGTVVAARAAVSDNLSPQHRPAGFSLLVLSFHIANAFGPLISAVSIGPTGSRPAVHAPDTDLSRHGILSWMANYPFAAPNLMSAFLLAGDALLVWCKLVEVHQGNDGNLQTLRSQTSLWMRRFAHRFTRTQGSVSSYDSEAVSKDIPLLREGESTSSSETLEPVWTPKFIVILLTVAILEFHLGAFGSLWSLFVVDTRRQADAPISLPFTFTGGLQLRDADLGFAVGALGIIGILLQLTLVPYSTAKYGAVRAFKASLPLFPASLLIAPYLALLPADYATALWLSISVVLLLHVIGRSFGILASILLVNQSTTQSSRRGTVHGIANAVASTCRALGSVAGGFLYGLGAQRDAVGLGWWTICGFSILGWAMGYGL